MKTIHILPTIKQKPTKLGFEELPDQSAFELVSTLYERAQKAGQPFKLNKLDRIKRKRPANPSVN